MLVSIRKHNSNNKKTIPLKTTAKKTAMEGNGRFEIVDIPQASTLHRIHKQTIIGNIPAKSNCYRIVTFKNKITGKSHASLAKDAKLKEYEKGFIYQCVAYRNAHINVDFKIELDVYFPTKKSDLDNSLKVLFDCLQAVSAISNDNLCQEINAKKHVDADKPRIEFTLTPLEPLQPWVDKKPKAKKKLKRNDLEIETIDEPII